MSCVPAAPRHPARDALLIAGLAFALRFGIALFSNGGLGGLYGYDAGVYYGAADALIHGRVPYRDFILLHPPLLMLVLTPFAALGRIEDHAGPAPIPAAGTDDERALLSFRLAQRQLGEPHRGLAHVPIFVG